MGDEVRQALIPWPVQVTAAGTTTVPAAVTAITGRPFRND
jgi:hypothetical protein